MEKSEKFDWKRGCTINFDMFTGLSKDVPMIKRNLSDLAGMFLDNDAYEKIMETENPVVYEYHTIKIPPTEGDLSFGYSVLYPGKVGDEYYFTKGHFHEKLYIAEIYHCVKGRGVILLENKDGDWKALEVKTGDICYVPGGYAHRSINVSDTEPFVIVFTHRADAGHDYGTIKNKGFRKIVLEKSGNPQITDNPKWNSYKNKRGWINE